jgi:predicted PhzF superfamily epimerase YddE/YHI9
VTVRAWHVDAFTGAPFAGNPAGVCLLDGWPAPSLMQRIAAEFNLAETAFVVPRGASSAELRWFTPAVEIDLCGHATLATAHVLFTHEGWSAGSITFSTASGPLTVERVTDGLLVMDFPARPPLPCEPSPALLKGLGKAPLEVRGARDYLAIYSSEEEVRGLAPDMAQLARIDRMGVIVTAPAAGAASRGTETAAGAASRGTETAAGEADFVSRFFAPGVGIPEDPVTGSSHCTLVPYWSRRLGKKVLRARQVSPRGGELFLEDRGERVKIGGRAVTFLAGEITV